MENWRYGVVRLAPSRCLSQPSFTIPLPTIPDEMDKTLNRHTKKPRFRQLSCDLFPSCLRGLLRSTRKSITVHTSATQLRAKERCDERKGTSVDSLCVLP